MQQSLLLAIRENDSEPLAVLLSTASVVEKANAALLAAFTNKSERLKQLIASGVDINRVDKDGNTCLHWAVENNNLPMLKLLLANGAEHRANKSGDTPAHLAEKKSYFKLLNALIQHYVIRPFTIDAQEESIDGNLVLKGEPEPAISVNTLQLLMQYRITKRDIDAANDRIQAFNQHFIGIELKDLERVMNPSFFRKFFRFLTSVSVVHTLLLLPLMNRNRIKLYEGIIKDDETAIVDRLSRQTSDDLFDSESESNRQALLTLSDEEPELSSDVDVERQPLINSQKDEEKILTNFSERVSQKSKPETSQALKKIRQKQGCSLPILTTYSIPFECETTQKTVLFLSTWHTTAEESFDGIWSLLWLSLLAQGLFNFYQYPEERFANQTVADVLGFNLPLNPNEHQILLSRALDSPILALILGIPALLGFLNAIRVVRSNQSLDNREVNALAQQLKRYHPDFLTDGLGWMLTAALPDAFAPLAFCHLLPQPAIKQALEQIQQHILWNGTLSAKDRLKLFSALYQFAHHRTQFTQMKALAMLATLANSIDAQILSLLQAEGVSDDNIKALLFIKAQSLQALDFLANHYHLPGVPKSLLRPFFRYLYANYLMWYIGYPQQWLVQPLFYLHRIVKLYFVFQFYYALILGIDRYIRERNINDVCSLLPDFRYTSHYEPQDCFREFLMTARTLKQLMEAIQLLPRFVSGGRGNTYIEIDLSFQNKLIQMNELPNILSALASVMNDNLIDVGDFILQNNQLSLKDMKAIGDFLVDIKENKLKNTGGYGLGKLDLSWSIIEIGGIKGLIEAGELGYLSYLLILSNVPLSDVDVAALANIVPYLDKVHLNNCNISAKSCLLLAEKIAQTKQPGSLTEVNLADNLIRSDCAEIMTKALPMGHLNLGGNNIIDNQGIEAFAEIFSKVPRRSRVLRISPESPRPTQIAPDELIVQVKSDETTIFYLNAEGKDWAHSYSGSFSFIDQIIPRLPAIGQETQDPELIKIITAECCTFYPGGKYFLSGYNVSDHSLLQLINALPGTGIRGFYYVDHQVNNTRNFSLIIPSLIEALNGTSIRYFGWNSPGGVGLGDEGTELLTNELIKNSAAGLIDWDLNDNQIGPNGIQKLTKILRFRRNEYSFRNNQIGSGITSFAEAIANKMRKSNSVYDVSLDLTNNDITENNIYEFAVLIQKAYETYFHPFAMKSLSFANNPIGDRGTIALVKLINRNSDFKRLKSLNLSQTNTSHIGAKAITDSLKNPRHLLWIETLIRSRFYSGYQMETLDLSNNFIDEESALTLCDAFARSKPNSQARIILTGNPINQTIIENCGHLISEGYSLRAHSPYVLMYRFYRGLYDVVSQRFFNADKALVVQSQNETTTEIALIESDNEINDFDTMDETAMVCIEVEKASTSLLYTSLFTICETFLRAVHQSAWLTAIPVFAEEILYRAGGYTREEVAKFHQELQALLMVSFANSPNSLAASYLARWLAQQLTDSPQVIATMGTGAALATSVFENVLNTPASWRWVALQTGVALMGSVLGSLSVQQIPKVSQWGANQFNRAKNYLGSRVSFWVTLDADKAINTVPEHAPPILPTVYSLNPAPHFKMH